MANSGDVFPRRQLPGPAEQWGRDVEARIVDAEKALEAIRTNMGSQNKAISGTQFDVAKQGSNLAASNVQPLPPGGLRLVSNSGVWRKGGVPVSIVNVAWNPVTLGTRDEPVDILTYQVWVREPSTDGSAAMSTKATTATIELQPGIPKVITVRAQSSRSVWSDMSFELDVDPAFPPSVVPKAPTNLLLQKNIGAFAPDNSARAAIEFTWNPVTESTANEPVTISEYEVWLGTEATLGAPIAMVLDPKYTASIPSGVARHYRVRALSDIGAWSDLSVPIKVEPNYPPQDRTPPSAPVLSSERAIVAAFWDGKLSTGVLPIAFRHVIVEVAFQTPPETGGDPWPPIVWKEATQPIAAGGTAVFSGKMGDKASVRFTAVDQLSRVGDPSVVTEIVVKGIVGDDIEVNSINANVIEAGTITVSLLEAGIGGKLDISANNMVQIIVGQQDQLSNDIAAANETIADNALGVTQAMNDAAGAQSSADEAKESATFAQALANAAKTDIEEQRTVYQFTDTAARIQTPGGEQALVMSPDSIAFEKNGVILTYWEGDQMVVSQIVVESANIGNHRWSAYGASRTIVQPL